ncbi:MAG: biosynthetic-type acetolactate synthase large subunit [Chloroflexota bacterium]|nr:biosynthetic-type acetolactate synthase large subunit [Chloroflexota bacterium]
MKKTGAQVLCEGLIHHGVEKIFGIPGGAILPLYGTLSEYPELDHILVRHEQGASHAADGFSRITGKTGVCFATSGPGATNLITGMATAMMDSSPMIAITGQVSRPGIGKDSFQEIDITGASLPVTKHNYLVMNADEIPRVLKEAFIIANTGRPGPVLIDIPRDVFTEEFDFDNKFWDEDIKILGYNPPKFADNPKIDKALKLIEESKKPVILAGHGIIISKAYDELLELAESAQIPVITTLLGISSFPENHVLSLSFPGMHGVAWASLALDQADLVIAIGSRFDDRITGDTSRFATRSKKIHIDIDPAEINKNIEVDVALIGNAKDILKQMLPKLKRKTHIDWLSHIEKLKEDHPSLKLKKSSDLTGQYVIKSLSDETEGKSVIVTGVGQHQMWAAQHYSYCSQNSWISSGGLGTMGFEVPAALGAKVGAPDKNVWSIAGDGGFQMTLCELATIVENNIKVKFALLNNNHLGMITQWQGMFFNEDYQANAYTANPDFVKLANAYGMKALSVNNNEDVRPAIREANSHDGPFLIDFKIKKEENVFPMIPSGQSVNELLEEPVDGSN